MAIGALTSGMANLEAEKAAELAAIAMIITAAMAIPMCLLCLSGRSMLQRCMLQRRMRQQVTMAAILNELEPSPRTRRAARGRVSPTFTEGSGM